MTFPVVPQYRVEESVAPCESLIEALKHESDWPLQQLFLLPHKWKWYAQRRRATSDSVSGSSALYRLYWFAGLNLGFIAFIKSLASAPGGLGLLRFFYRRIASALLITKWRVVDRSDKLLVLKHELIRHSEMELFVRKQEIKPAVALLIALLDALASRHSSVSDSVRQQIAHQQLKSDLDSLRGKYTHNCPICIRRLLPDDTLISMASGEDEWYAISLISYARDRTSFYKAMSLVAKLLADRFDARIHWGKWLPLDAEAIEKAYPKMSRFRDVCEAYDSDGVFRNAFTKRTLSLSKAKPEQPAIVS